MADRRMNDPAYLNRLFLRLGIRLSFVLKDVGLRTVESFFFIENTAFDLHLTIW
jgi:hypothetical protein